MDKAAALGVRYETQDASFAQQKIYRAAHEKGNTTDSAASAAKVTDSASQAQILDLEVDAISTRGSQTQRIDSPARSSSTATSGTSAKGTPAKNQQRPARTCYNCAKTGHMARECPEKLKQKATAAAKAQQVKDQTVFGYNLTVNWTDTDSRTIIDIIKKGMKKGTMPKKALDVAYAAADKKREEKKKPPIQNTYNQNRLARKAQAGTSAGKDASSQTKPYTLIQECFVRCSAEALEEILREDEEETVAAIEEPEDSGASSDSSGESSSSEE